MRGDGGENAVEGDGVEDEIGERDADREEQVADAVDDERLDRRRVGGRPVIPVVDEQIGDEADPFPAEEQLHQVVGRHQHQHREGEQRDIGEEARHGLVMRHVADAVDMDHQRDGADHRHHHQRQHVLAQRPVRREAADRNPVGDMQRRRRHAGMDQHDEGRHPGDGRDDHEQDAGADRQLLAKERAADAREHGTEKRCENGDQR